MDSPKKLYRSRKRWLGGVCGGIGEYFNTDPTIIRVIWVVLSLVYGIGIVAYIVAWLLIPMSPN